MDMDLNARSAKWKREQEKLKERARRQAQTEALKRAAAAKAQAAMEQVQAQKRQERIEEQERQEQLALEEQRLTGGIKYQQTLAPFPTRGDGDKITLPVSALETLNPQGAFDNGAFTFELSFTVPGASSGSGSSQNSSDSAQNVLRRTTHAGVLEFVADEGTVGLPPKVARSLFDSDFVPAQIQVKYVRLEKGASASLRPCGEGFGDRALDWKALLERALRAHTTLSSGDVVLVRHARETFALRVAALAPADAVSVLNTDLEVALLPSEAVEARLQREAAQKRAQERAQQAAEARQRRAQEREQQRQQRCAELLAQLAPEPPADDKFQAKIVLRLPGGSQATRRVAHDAALRRVFELVEASTGDASELFQLVATYPRRVFGVDAQDKTLKELGLNGRQEALFVEKIAEGAPQQEEEEDEAVDVEMEEVGEPVAATLLPAAWQEAQRELEQHLDEALNAHESTPIHALEPVMPVADAAADQSTKWQAQLAELAAMGFTNDALNIQVLERYQGRLLRVVNYLSELASSSSATDEPPLIEPMQE